MIRTMTEAFIRQIMTWQYPEPYGIYNMCDEEDIIEEMMDGSYYAVVDENDLVGFLCYGKNAQVPHEPGYEAGYLDIGLGMKPDYCGQGRGLDFVLDAIDFGKKHFDLKKIRLTVASFNKRAIKVYQRAGFKSLYSFDRVKPDKTVTFIVMVQAS